MLLKIHGRTRFFNDRIQALTRISAGKYRLDTSIGTYGIFGGKAAGGTSRDWYVHPIGETLIFKVCMDPKADQYMHATSLTAAIELVAGA